MVVLHIMNIIYPFCRIENCFLSRQSTKKSAAEISEADYVYMLSYKFFDMAFSKPFED